MSKIFDIVSDIADKAGRLPTPPQIVIDLIEQNRAFGKPEPRIDIQFTGPLAQAQQLLFSMQPVKNTLNDLAQASVIYPNVLKRINDVALSNAIVDANNTPAGIVNSDEEVQEMIEAEQMQLAQQQMMEMAQQVPGAYKDLNETVQPDSPAEAAGEAIAETV